MIATKLNTMKQILLSTFIFTLICVNVNSQVLNQDASWPNEDWNLSGVYDPLFLYEDPTTAGGSSSFSFDDDDAGSGSINFVATESPIINVAAAANAGRHT